MGEKIWKAIAAAAGAVASFFCGLPPILWVLLAVMTLDYLTGILCGIMGKSQKTEHGGLSSSTAFTGLLKKLLIIAIVALAYLLDHAVTLNVGVQFAAVSGATCLWFIASEGISVSGATCLWFIASEGISVVENAAQMGVPIPKALKQALEVMKGHGDEPQQKKEKSEEEKPKDEH